MTRKNAKTTETLMDNISDFLKPSSENLMNKGCDFLCSDIHKNEEDFKCLLKSNADREFKKIKNDINFIIKYGKYFKK